MKNVKTNKQELQEIDKLMELQEQYINNLQAQLDKERAKLVELEHQRIVTANKVIIDKQNKVRFNYFLKNSVLERHLNAPELNKLHINGKAFRDTTVFKCPHITDIKQAVWDYIHTNY